MATVPDFRRFPYQEEKILSYKHEQLADYLKLLVKDLSDMYVEVASALNDLKLSGVTPHHTTHEDTGSDEINVAGLSGELVDPQPPKIHKTSHQNGGTDEISVAGLNGVLADKQDANKLQGRNVDAAVPNDADVLTWDQPNTKWKPAAGGGGGGKIVQVVNTQTGAVATGTTPIPYDDTIPQNTEGNEYMTLSITPTNVNNKLKIDVRWFGSWQSGVYFMTVALFETGAGSNALAAGGHYGAGGDLVSIVLNHYMTAGTTSTLTFRVRAGGHAAGTTTFNGTAGARCLGGVMASSITIMEIAA